jgi:hypothetical protein
MGSVLNREILYNTHFFNGFWSIGMTAILSVMRILVAIVFAILLCAIQIGFSVTTPTALVVFGFALFLLLATITSTFIEIYHWIDFRLYYGKSIEAMVKFQDEEEIKDLDEPVGEMFSSDEEKINLHGCLYNEKMVRRFHTISGAFLSGATVLFMSYVLCIIVHLVNT